MEHLSFNATPITPLPYFSEKYNVELLAKRDDLFSSALGGSKARMLQYILYPLLSRGAKTIVTAVEDHVRISIEPCHCCAQVME